MGEVICTIYDWQVCPRYENNPSQINTDMAIAVLVAEEAIWLYETDDNHIAIAVCCNDIFAWGVSDSEKCSLEEIEEVYNYWSKDKIWGTGVWCMIKRREMCQPAVIKNIEESGAFNVEELRVKHNLKPCWYEMVSRNISEAKYKKYAAWCAEKGAAPLSFDSEWWTGWAEYIKVHPDWHENPWYKEILVATRAHYETL